MWAYYKNRIKRVMNKDKSHAQSPAPWGSSGHDRVRGCGVTLPGKIGGAKIAIGPGWLKHIEAGPKVRSREVVKRITTPYSPPAPDKGFCRCGNHPPSSPAAYTAVKSSLVRL